MILRPIVFIALINLVAAPAFAQTFTQPDSVVELFTSQGCSSCPPANAAITHLDETQPDVLALSYGVTYWDYLGWPDSFGDPEFTARQRQYDSALMSGVYTPMFVKAGREHASRVTRVGLSQSDVPRTIMFAHRSGELCVEGPLASGAKLALVEYVPGKQTVAVKKGENSGRTLTLSNVVTEIAYHDWSGESLCGLNPQSALAVLAHDANTSEIVGAARFEP